MKILLYGENWEGTHVDCISKALDKKNIENKIFDFYSVLTYKTKYLLLNKILRRLNYKRNEVKINKLFLIEFNRFKPDLVVISKGINIHPKTLKLILNNCKVINWNPDDFFNTKNNSRNLLNSVPLYDLVLSARKHLFQEYEKLGFKKLKYIEWYYIPWLHKPSQKEVDKNKKICFIGTYSKRREYIIDSISSNYLIEIWGSGWKKSNLNLKKNIKIHNQILNQKDFPEIIKQSYINLNILTLENRDQTNLKIFEITASNGLILTEDNSTSRVLLKNNGFYYKEDNLNEIIQIIYNLSETEYQDQISLSHQAIIEGNNSIYDRVNEILNYLI